MKLFLQCCAQQDFLGCHTMQFVPPNVAKVELGSTSAFVARNVARKVVPYVRAFRSFERLFYKGNPFEFFFRLLMEASFFGLVDRQ